MIIVLDGPDGGGKTGQVTRIHDFLNERDPGSTLMFRDPGGTPSGERIRGLVKSAEVPMAKTTQFLMFAAARAELAAHIWTVYGKTCKHIVLDRWIYSTMAYQGAQGIDETLIMMVGNATSGLPEMPLPFLLDVSPEVAKKRMASDSRVNDAVKDRYENMDPRFHEDLRRRYKFFVGSDNGMILINTDDKSADEVFETIKGDVVARLLKDAQ